MASRRDAIIVVDIEATCWDCDPPPGDQVSEIIEIGLCRYDVAGDRVYGKRSILVKPIASEISPFCTRLTSLTPRMVAEDGIDFDAACRILVETVGARERLWASWGGLDERLFRRQCRRQRVAYPFGKRHLNLRKVFTEFNGGKRVGMARALKLAGLAPEGEAHRGADDAWNCARLLQYLARAQGIDSLMRSGR